MIHTCVVHKLTKDRGQNKTVMFYKTMSSLQGTWPETFFEHVSQIIQLLMTDSTTQIRFFF